MGGRGGERAADERAADDRTVTIKGQEAANGRQVVGKQTSEGLHSGERAIGKPAASERAVASGR